MLVTRPQELLPLHSHLYSSDILREPGLLDAVPKPGGEGLLDSSRVLLFNPAKANNTMTTTRSPSNPPWVLQKAVLVYTADYKDFCPARLRISHDKIAGRGSISLRITADLANLNGRSQVLTLNIPPQSVEECALALISNDLLCPPRLLLELPAPETKVSEVVTLSLKLGTTGIVLCPSKMESLRPAKQGDSQFHTFAKICRSNSLRLHFSRRQFVGGDLAQLKIFSSALRKGTLLAEVFGHARQGVVPRDWHVFYPSLDPPPYCEKAVSEQVDPPPGIL